MLQLLHAKKINRRQKGGGHRSVSTPLNTPLSTSHRSIVARRNCSEIGK